MHNIWGSIGRLLSRDDRGASGVEYALVISLLLAGSSASMEMMDTRVEEHYSETADDIGQSDLSRFDVTTTTCASCPTTTSTTTTTTTVRPTTTTAAPTTTRAPTTTTTTTTTTAAPTTTTTRAPTTTTTTTTTTTAKPTTAADATASNSSGYVKKDKAYAVKGSITLETSDGKDIKKADVTYTIKLKTGQTKTFTGTTSNKGKLTIDWGDLSSDAVYPATITITSVTLDGETFTPKPATFVWYET